MDQYILQIPETIWIHGLTYTHIRIDKSGYKPNIRNCMYKLCFPCNPGTLQPIHEYDNNYDKSFSQTKLCSSSEPYLLLTCHVKVSTLCQHHSLSQGGALNRCFPSITQMHKWHFTGATYGVLLANIFPLL